ncbi:hypothetical protein HD554DRAFT_2024647 [Boletus coccyginus]|nr:hypothetical protein HD554DRAFT_2024647 [Boletus coccyginus]
MTKQIHLDQDHPPAFSGWALLHLQVLICKNGNVIAPTIHKPCSLHCPIGSHSTLSNFIMVPLLSTIRHNTSIVKHNAIPEFVLKDATFDFPINLSLPISSVQLRLFETRTVCSEESISTRLHCHWKFDLKIDMLLVSMMIRTRFF